MQEIWFIRTRTNFEIVLDGNDDDGVALGIVCDNCDCDGDCNGNDDGHSQCEGESDDDGDGDGHGGFVSDGDGNGDGDCDGNGVLDRNNEGVLGGDEISGSDDNGWVPVDIDNAGTVPDDGEYNDANPESYKFKICH